MKTKPPHRRRPAYPGLDPFSFAHHDLFFGRGSEGRVVAAMVAAEPISILTGASGTGKSSLLRAMIIPTLISRGWCVVYLHPADDPLAALARELIAQALPDIDSEISLIERIIAVTQQDVADSHRLHGGSLLSEACDWFRKLPFDDLRRTELIGDNVNKVPHIPLIALALTGILQPDEVLGRLIALAKNTKIPEQSTSFDATFDEICALKEPAILARTKIISELFDDSPLFVDLIDKLWHKWIHRLGQRGLIFILDQAEELYTAFGASSQGLNIRSAHSRTIASSPKLRDQFFMALPSFVNKARRLPFRFCISLRPEWYTDLRISLGEVVPDESRAMHILRDFQRNQASGAIGDPVRHLGGNVDMLATENIINALEAEGEGRGIDPFLLGLICRFAWEFADARTLPQNTVHIETFDIDKITYGLESASTDIPNIGTVIEIEPTLHPLIQGALRWLLYYFLNNLNLNQQFDAIDIFDSLFTQGGTRRIVSESELVNKPLRHKHQLQALLTKMEEARLIRVIERNAEKFIEVRHDRLVEPLLSYKTRIAAEAESVQLSRGRYRWLLNEAIDHVLRPDGKRLARTIAEGLQVDYLPGWARESLRSNRDAIQWDVASARSLLASLLYSGPLITDPEAIPEYREALQDILSAATEVQENKTFSEFDLKSLAKFLQRGVPMSRKALNHFDTSIIKSLPIDARLMLLDSILRSSMQNSKELSREEIIDWTRLCLGLDQS